MVITIFTTSSLTDYQAEGATRADADDGRFVEVHRIHRRHPAPLLVEHEHARVGPLILGRDLAPSGHVRLTDEEEEMKIFLRRQGHLVRREKRGNEEEGKNKKESSHRRPESGSLYDWSSLSKDDFAPTGVDQVTEFTAMTK